MPWGKRLSEPGEQEAEGARAADRPLARAANAGQRGVALPRRAGAAAAAGLVIWALSVHRP